MNRRKFYVTHLLTSLPLKCFFYVWYLHRFNLYYITLLILKQPTSCQWQNLYSNSRTHTVWTEYLTVYYTRWLLLITLKKWQSSPSLVLCLSAGPLSHPNFLLFQPSFAILFLLSFNPFTRPSIIPIINHPWSSFCLLPYPISSNHHLINQPSALSCST